MTTYRVEPAYTAKYQNDTKPFSVQAKNIDEFRKKLILRKSDATLLMIYHPITMNHIGNLIKKSGVYIWETNKGSWNVLRNGKLQRRY